MSFVSIVFKGFPVPLELDVGPAHVERVNRRGIDGVPSLRARDSHPADRSGEDRRLER